MQSKVKTSLTNINTDTHAGEIIGILPFFNFSLTVIAETNHFLLAYCITADIFHSMN